MILDMYAGPGGWDEGLRLLGRDDVIGIECDKDAVATREAAGHWTLATDARLVSTADFTPFEGLIASPPCQTFSDAGPGGGKASLSALVRACEGVLAGCTPVYAMARNGLASDDPRSSLVLEPLRFVRDHQPLWLAFEEVPPVLPVFKALAYVLADHGYGAWAGILNAADYGVPQKRRRAFLLATLGASPPLPLQTHAQTTEGSWGLYELLPWVTMAQALDLGPRPNDATAWAWDRPATTVVRSFCPDVIAAPGYRSKGDPSRQNAPGSIKVTPEQLCVLQGIRTDYPFQGAAGKRLSLTGAVLPPPWAAAILAPLLAHRPKEHA